MGFQKAKKEQIWVKLLLNAPSGGGKTYGALRVATGLAKACNSRIAAIDTDRSRGLGDVYKRQVESQPLTQRMAAFAIMRMSLILMICSSKNHILRRSISRLLMRL